MSQIDHSSTTEAAAGTATAAAAAASSSTSSAAAAAAVQCKCTHTHSKHRWRSKNEKQIASVLCVLSAHVSELLVAALCAHLTLNCFICDCVFDARVRPQWFCRIWSAQACLQRCAWHSSASFFATMLQRICASSCYARQLHNAKSARARVLYNRQLTTQLWWTVLCVCVVVVRTPIAPNGLILCLKRRTNNTARSSSFRLERWECV